MAAGPRGSSDSELDLQRVAVEAQLLDLHPGWAFPSSSRRSAKSARFVRPVTMDGLALLGDHAHAGKGRERRLQGLRGGRGELLAEARLLDLLLLHALGECVLLGDVLLERGHLAFGRLDPAIEILALYAPGEGEQADDGKQAVPRERRPSWLLPLSVSGVGGQGGGPV